MEQLFACVFQGIVGENQRNGTGVSQTLRYHSMYKCLDKLQKDGQHILLLNRNDQAGFHLDSTYTHESTPSLNAGFPNINHTH